MENNKQSAVQWFYDKMKSHFEYDGDLLETVGFTTSLAKYKERELLIFVIQEAYMNGRNDESDNVEIADGINETIDALLKFTIDKSK